MEKRLLGTTGLFVTPIGLGLAALGRPGYINLNHAEDLGRNYDVSAMEAHAHAVLDAAWRSGVRYFDAARSYGRAEQFLSSWLRSRQTSPNDVTVASKWGYTYTADWQVTAEKHEIKEHSKAVLQRQTLESLELLHPFLRVYQIHSATLDSGVLDNREVLDELAGLRDAGLYIGLSLSGPQQAETLQRAVEISIGGRPLFAVAQVTWNLLSREAEDSLHEASRAGMGIVVKEALANGRLTARNNDPAFAEKRRLLETVATELDTTIDALALAAVLARPWASVVLSGAANSEQLLSNLAALQVQWSDDVAARLDPLVESPEEYWTARSRLAWN